MRFSRAHWIVGIAAACILFAVLTRTRSVHTDDIKVKPGRLTCKVVNPHDYPVEVQLAASFVSRRSSVHKHIPGVQRYENAYRFESTSMVKIRPRTSKDVEFTLQDEFSYTLYPQVLVEHVERLIDMEF